MTWPLSGAGRYVEWTPADSGLDLLVEAERVEAERMVWAGRYTPVPAVLYAGVDGDGSCLVTSAVDAVPQVLAWRATKAGKQIVVLPARDTTQKCDCCGAKAKPRIEPSLALSQASH